MRSFIFDGVEFNNLNTLGQAFKENYPLALEAIKDKSFVSFIKQFKEKKKLLISILYDCRYLGSALSLLIYEMTEDKILIIGGKEYYSLEGIVDDYDTNKDIKMFIYDKGLSKTICSSLSDEKLKSNILAVEKYYNDSFSIKYLKDYMKYDSISPVEQYIDELLASNDRFSKAIDMFNDDDFLMILAHKFGLDTVLAVRFQKCRVFDGLKLISDENNLSELLKIFENSFFVKFNSDLKKYKNITNRSKVLIKEYKKNYKLYKKNISFDSAKKLYESYAKIANIFVYGEIKAKKNSEDLDLCLPYSSTYVSKKFVNESSIIIREDEKIDNVIPNYDIRKFGLAIRNHSAFGKWSIFLALVSLVLVITCFVLGKTSIMSSVDIMYYGIGLAGALMAFIFAIIVLIKNCKDRKRYNILATLSYYRNNELILTNKQLLDYKKLLLEEDKLPSKIDRGYRFIGAILMLFLALAVNVGGGLLLANFVNISIFVKLEKVFNGELMYLLFIPSAVLLMLGLLRRKKTCWSAILSFILALVILVGLLFIF